MAIGRDQATAQRDDDQHHGFRTHCVTSAQSNVPWTASVTTQLSRNTPRRLSRDQWLSLLYCTRSRRMTVVAESVVPPRYIGDGSQLT